MLVLRGVILVLAAFVFAFVRDVATALGWLVLGVLALVLTSAGDSVAMALGWRKR